MKKTIITEETNSVLNIALNSFNIDMDEFIESLINVYGEDANIEYNNQVLTLINEFFAKKSKLNENLQYEFFGGFFDDMEKEIQTLEIQKYLNNNVPNASAFNKEEVTNYLKETFDLTDKQISFALTRVEEAYNTLEKFEERYENEKDPDEKIKLLVNEKLFSTFTINNPELYGKKRDYAFQEYRQRFAADKIIKEDKEKNNNRIERTKGFKPMEIGDGYISPDGR